MTFSIARVALTCGLLLLAGCGSAPQQGPVPGPPMDRPADPRFIAPFPDGPITPPPEPAEAADALAAARAATGTAGQLAAFGKAADLGSPDGRFFYATMLADGAAGRERMEEGFDMMLALTKQGHGPAALFLWRLSKLSRSPNLNQHAPYWFNIARRTGDATANSTYAELLAHARQADLLPPGTGSGDYFDSAISFSPRPKDDEEGAVMEQKVADYLFPRWTRVARTPHRIDERRFDVLELENVEGQRVKLYFEATP